MPKSHSRFLLSIALFFATLTSSWAGELDVDLTGLSYHIGASSSHPAYTSAPRRLDKNGVFVFNPGVGIGYDFRKSSGQSGFSGLTKLVYFRDCDDRSFFMGGGGVRYRYMLGTHFSIDLNALLMLSAGRDWDTDRYNYSVLPLVLLGTNYHFKNGIALGTNFTVAPRNTSFSATSGFWILFTTLQVSVPIPL